MPKQDPEVQYINGEPVDILTAKISGEIFIKRKLREGEKVCIVLEGTVAPGFGYKSKNGMTTVNYTLALDTAREPEEDMVEDIIESLRNWTDEQDGVISMDFPTSESDD